MSSNNFIRVLLTLFCWLPFVVPVIIVVSVDLKVQALVIRQCGMLLNFLEFVLLLSLNTFYFAVRVRGIYDDISFFMYYFIRFRQFYTKYVNQAEGMDIFVKIVQLHQG